MPVWKEGDEPPPIQPDAPQPVRAIGPRPVEAICPHCMAKLQIEPSFAGLPVACPTCRGRFQAPLPKAADPNEINRPFCDAGHFSSTSGDTRYGDSGALDGNFAGFQSRYSSTRGPARARAELNPGIPICILVSGIANIVIGCLWICTILGVVIGVPQLILGLFEIVYFCQSSNVSTQQAIAKARILGVLEIVSGLANLVSLICGIMVVVFSHNHRISR